jgi:hypothetical protein
MSARIGLLLAFLPLAGCAAGIEPAPLPASHPASVEAEEAPPSIASDTLAIPPAGKARPSRAPTPERPNHRGGHHAHH